MRFRKGDDVVAITGNDKNKHGVIMAILPKNKLIVKGINKRKKHKKPVKEEKKSGSIVEFDAPIDISNVAYFAEGKARKLLCRKNGTKKEIYYLNDSKAVKVIRAI